MTPEIIAILVLILVGSLILAIDVWRWLKATGLKYVWCWSYVQRWLKAKSLKDTAIWLAKLLLIPVVLIGGVRWWWSIQPEDSIWVTVVLVLAGVLMLVRLLIWERYVRLHAPKVAEVEAGTTIWDVAKVILVPAVLSLGLLWLNVAQADRQDRIEQTRIAERAEATGTSQTVQAVTATAGQATQAAATGASQAIQSTVEANRVNANILQSYFDDMTTFVLAGSTTITQTEVQSLIRARTLIVLSDLDGKRNGTVLRFLQELRTETELFDLVKDDLEGINLAEADLRRTNLSGANLRLADLRFANLSEADLRFADLSWTALSGAILRGADLRGAKLSGAILSGAVIDDSTQIDDKWRLVWEIVNQGATRRDLSEADLSGADLMEAYLIEADLSGANLSDAYLNDADLGDADLSGADLYGADLRWAKLSGAILSGANYNTAPFQDELGNTYKPTQWPDDFDPLAAGAIDVSETP